MKQNDTRRVSVGLAPACHRLPVESMNACTCMRREQRGRLNISIAGWGAYSVSAARPLQQDVLGIVE